MNSFAIRIQMTSTIRHPVRRECAVERNTSLVDIVVCGILAFLKGKDLRKCVIGVTTLERVKSLDSFRICYVLLQNTMDTLLINYISLFLNLVRYNASIVLFNFCTSVPFFS